MCRTKFQNWKWKIVYQHDFFFDFILLIFGKLGIWPLTCSVPSFSQIRDHDCKKFTAIYIWFNISYFSFILIDARNNYQSRTKALCLPTNGNIVERPNWIRAKTSMIKSFIWWLDQLILHFILNETLQLIGRLKKNNTSGNQKLDNCNRKTAIEYI